MKTFNTLLLIIFCFAIISCDKNSAPDPIKFIPTETLYDKNIYSPNINLIWNGDTVDFKKEGNSMLVRFYPDNSDSTKLNMRLNAFRPIDLELTANIISNNNKIVFSGSSNLKPYDLEVTGVYTPSEDLEEPGELELNCKYKINDFWLKVDYQYIFRFDDRCMNFISFPVDSLEWDGQTIAKMDFVEETLNEICDRVGKETAAIGLTFHADETVDIQIQKPGENFKQVANFQYSLGYLDNGRTIYLRFNDEQAYSYEYECIGWEDLTMPLFYHNANIKYLTLNFIEGYETMCLYYPYPYEQVTLRRYLKNAGSEGLSDKEKEKLILFYNSLIEKGKMDHHILFVSEPYQ